MLLRKKCPYSEFFLSVFSRIQKISECGHFLRSVYDESILEEITKQVTSLLQ